MAEDFRFLEQILDQLSSISAAEEQDDRVKGQSQTALCSILSQIITSFSQ